MKIARSENPSYYSGLSEVEKERLSDLLKSDGMITLPARELASLYEEISHLRLEVAAFRDASPAASKVVDLADENLAAPESLQVSVVFASRTNENTRIRNVCSSLGLRTLGDICRHSRADLLARRNFGRKCLEQMEEVLSLHGLTLKE